LRQLMLVAAMLAMVLVAAAPAIAQEAKAGSVQAMPGGAGKAPEAKAGGAMAKGCPPEAVAKAGGAEAKAPCPPPPPPPKAAPPPPPKAAPPPPPKAAPPPPPKAAPKVMPPTGGLPVSTVAFGGLGASALLVGGGLLALRLVRRAQH
jgi:outer membrane biosynthesis protein TonB